MDDRGRARSDDDARERYARTAATAGLAPAQRTVRGTGAPSAEERGGAAPRARDGAGEAAPRRDDRDRPDDPLVLPSPSLPRGGGAIRSIGERFQVAAATGTASLRVPLPLPPGRAGFTPDLELVYDSGAGNSPFGLGWNVAAPAVARRTDEGVPRYLDAATDIGDHDTFVFGGGEDLVPDPAPPATVVEDGRRYAVRAYRPRVQVAFARIERWREHATGEEHWRVTSRDNVRSLLGADADHRVADPEDPSRVFQWLLQEVRSDRGDVQRYTYVLDDDRRVPAATLSEAGRVGRPVAQRYLKRVDYTRVPGGAGGAEAFCFSVVLDYGDHDDVAPGVDADRPWPVREDPFSTHRPGFEVRTRRRCRRVLTFHRFPGPGGLGPGPRLVRALELGYDGSPEAAHLTSVTEVGFVPGRPPQRRPPLRFSYTAPADDPDVHVADAPTLPVGVAPERGYWFADLHGDGIGGVLTEAAGGWFYARSRGGGSFERARPLPSHPSGSQVPPGPGAPRLVDLDASGALCLVDLSGPTPGSWAVEREEDFAGSRLGAPRQPDADDAPRWEPHRSFDRLPSIDWDGDPSLRLIDLSGDGRPDVALFGDELLTFHPSEGRAGFGPPRTSRLDRAGAPGPRVAFAAGDEAVVLADMSGDGLVDVVRVRNGSVRYWPNQGGRFGPPVDMDAAPVFDHHGRFDPRRLRTADVHGTGTADLVYLDGTRTRVWANHAGNGFGPPRTLSAAPPYDEEAVVEVYDLLGSGTSQLVWSSPLPDARGAAHTALRYLDLSGGRKPHLLERFENGIGGSTTVEYAPSTRFYLADRAEGRPWATRLPFPVHVVARTVTTDHVTGSSYSARYAYHHGTYDAADREFRGFARVDRWDTDDFDPASAVDQPPVRTVTWFHTGVLTPDGGDLQARMATEFWDGDAQAFPAPRSPLPSGLAPDERRHARRALRGRPLRVEVYAEDGTPEAATPYAVTEHAYETVRLQAGDGARRPVFFVSDRETRSTHYERDPTDPRCTQSLILAVDEWGNVTEAATVGHPRRNPAGPAAAAQAAAHVTYTTTTFANRSDGLVHRLGTTVERRSYAVTGLAGPPPGRAHAPAALRDACRAAQEVPPETDPATLPAAQPRRRLLMAERRVYWDDALAQPAPLGDAGRRALVRQVLAAALSPGMVAAAYAPRGVGQAELTGSGEGDGAYVAADGLLWAPSDVVAYDPAAFYLPTTRTTPFGHTSGVAYDRYALLLERTSDALPGALANVVTVTNHYRVLDPVAITDPNGDSTTARFDAFGRVVATAFQGAGGEGDLLDPAADEVSPLDDPTTRVTYADREFVDHGRPCFTRADAREVHRSDLGAPGDPVRRLVTVVYSDGLGREAQTKVLGEPGPAPTRDPVTGRLLAGTTAVADPRWIGTGRLVRNNKGSPVRRYEPYFAPDDRYDTEAELVETGVSATLTYDPAGRVVAVDAPNGTRTRTVFTPWETETWDENDTVRESAWFAARSGLPAGDPERRAADLADAHRETPERAHLDAVGRTVVTVGVSRRAEGGQPAVEHVTRFELDPLGRVLAAVDPRGTVAVRRSFDLLGGIVREVSSAGGESVAMSDAAGRPARSWEGPAGGPDEIALRLGYDENGRPARRLARVGAGPESVREVHVYGEGHPDASARRLRGALWRTYDGAGVSETARLDHKGNPLETSRRLTADASADPDWSVLDAVAADPASLDAAAAPLLQPAAARFTARGRYDALDRPTSSEHPDGSVVANRYGPSGLLVGVDVTLPGGAPVAYVRSVQYDERARRTSVAYGNNTVRTFTYDRLTARLARSVTTRAASAGPPALAAVTLQDLTFTYDPVGNVVQVADAAQQNVFFDNAVVPPGTTYDHDALYRITSATGREHAGPNPPEVPDEVPYPLQPLPHPNDAQALRAYRQRYEYDANGNLLAVVHESGGVVRWRRGYDYEAASDRLVATSAPGDPAGTFSRTAYAHDAHGRLVRLPHLAALDWDDTNALRHVDLGGGGDAWYAYDAAGERARAVVARVGGTRVERVYLGGWEILRETTGAGTLRTERATLHVSDGEGRVALVETTAVENGGAPAGGPRVAVRYQLDDHLGSVLVETDERGGVLSFETFYPFGQTAYQSGRGAAEVSRKRYRFNGNERDDETGFDVGGARYYVPWLGRWLSPDPAGYVDGINRYAYVANRPVAAKDRLGEFLNFVAGAIGAVAGAIVGGTIEAVRQLVTEGRITSLSRIGAAAAGGAVAGGLAGLTGGASLLVQAGGVLAGSVAGGMVTRAINGERVLDPGAMIRDGVVGLVTFGILRGGGAALGRLRGGGAPGAGGGAGAGAGGRAGATAGAEGAAETGAARSTARAGTGAGQARSVAERVAAGEIPPPPPRGPVPPGHADLGAFGKAIGWGSHQTPEAARAAARAVPADHLARNGVTREVLEKWREFYRYFARYEPRNPTAPGRAAFIDELLRRFFPTPGQVAAAGAEVAAVPAGAAAVPAGTQPPSDPTESATGASSEGVGAGARPGLRTGGGVGAPSDEPGPTPGLIYDYATGRILPGWFLPPPQAPTGPPLPERPDRAPGTTTILQLQF